MKKKIPHAVVLIVFTMLLVVGCTSDTSSTVDIGNADTSHYPFNNARLGTLMVRDDSAQMDIQLFHQLDSLAIVKLNPQAASNPDSLNKMMLRAYTIRAEELLNAIGVDSNQLKNSISVIIISGYILLTERESDSNYISYL